MALDLNLNSTGRLLGTLTFDAASVFNSSGNRTSTLRVYASTDGSSWSQLSGANLPFSATNNVPSSAAVSVELPESLDNQATLKLRFYYHNGGQAAPSPAGSRPKISIDNVLVTSSSAVADTTPPAIATLVPADDSSNVLPTENLVITYDENVQAMSGNVTIRRLDNNDEVEAIPVPSGQVQIAGTAVTVNPSVVLDYNTEYHVEIAAGTFQDASNNPAAAVSGNSTWNFQTRGQASVVINQYYEGTGIGTSRYIELKNLTNSPITLTNHRLVAWSTSEGEPGNQAWKSGAVTTIRETSLNDVEIPANGHFLIADSGATTPPYAGNNNDLAVSFPSGLAFSGTASVVLYSTADNDRASVVDAVSIVGNEGTDTSFYRLNNGVGFDFTQGTSITAYSNVWASRSLNDVNSAAVTDAWYLSASSAPKVLTLSIDPTSFYESAGVTAATATVARDGSTTEALLVVIESSDSTEATADLTVEIPAGQVSAQFPITAVDDPWIDGNQIVTITVSADGYSPDSKQVTVLDDPGDPMFPIVINELDADQAVVNTVNDASEFVELYNNSSQPVSLDGVVMVFYNGGTTASPLEASYRTINLSGNIIPANGFFVVGNPGVSNVSVTFPADNLQNGADAVALYIGKPASSYPTNTLASTAPGILIDAVVYGTNDADATLLLNALTPGKIQVDEGANPASETVSIARVPDGGAPFDSALYVAQAPTPGTTNVPTPPGNNFADWIDGFEVGLLTGFNDDFDNDGLDNALENILGSSPAVANQGLTAVSVSAGSLKFRHTLAAEVDIADDLTYEYEWSANLVNWQASGVEAGGITVTFGLPAVITPGTPDLVEVTATVAGTGASKVFARLRVDQVGAPQ